MASEALRASIHSRSAVLSCALPPSKAVVLVMPELILTAVMTGIVVRQLKALLWPPVDILPHKTPWLQLPQPAHCQWVVPWERGLADWTAWAAGALLAVAFVFAFSSLLHSMQRTRSFKVTWHGSRIVLTSTTVSRHGRVVRLPARSIRCFAQSCLSHMLADESVSSAAVVVSDLKP